MSASHPVAVELEAARTLLARLGITPVGIVAGHGRFPCLTFPALDKGLRLHTSQWP
ncbi:MAG: hypothetical protein QOE61_1976 [Micromonosporaceae bacterium]|jgi:hypothetical protein|nr:hypothetical protein [Micromonosporaceae bacterium]